MGKKDKKAKKAAKKAGKKNESLDDGVSSMASISRAANPLSQDDGAPPPGSKSVRRANMAMEGSDEDDLDALSALDILGDINVGAVPPPPSAPLRLAAHTTSQGQEHTTKRMTQSVSFEAEQFSAENIEDRAIFEASFLAPNYRKLCLVEVPGLTTAQREDGLDLTTAIERMVEKGGKHSKAIDKTITAGNGDTLAKLSKEEESVPRCILSPESATSTLWKTIQAFVVFWIYIELPFRLAFFNHKATFWFTEVVTLAIDSLLLMDLILGFFTGYFEVDKETQQRRLVFESAKIRTNYLKGAFTLNFITCFPFDTIVRFLGYQSESVHLRLIRMLRVGKLVACVAEFQRIFAKLPQMWSGFKSLGKFSSALSIIASTAFFNHIIACFLFWAGRPEWDDCVPPGEPPTCERICVTTDSCGWVTKHLGIDPNTGMDTASVKYMYVSAFYYAFTIIATVGFGDISASSEFERAITTFAMLIGCLVFGVILSKIGGMVQMMDGPGQMFASQMSEYDEYMTVMNTSSKLQKQVRHYFTQAYPKRHIFEEKTMLARLPLGLRIDIVAERFGPILFKAPFMPAGVEGETDDNSCIEAVIQRMMSRTALVGECIINEGAVGQELYFIVSGQVWAHVSQKEGPVSVMSDHDYFGEIAVMLGTRRKATCTASKLTYLCYVSASDFRALCDDFKSFKRKVEQYTSDWLQDFMGDGNDDHTPSRHHHAMRKGKNKSGMSQIDRLEEHLVRIEDLVYEIDTRHTRNFESLQRDVNSIYCCVNESLA